MKIAAIYMGDDLFRKYMMSKYSASIKSAGAECIWIDKADDILSFDGLLLPGGADVNPKLYGEEPIAECGKPNTFRDELELEILDIWLKEDKPLLAICRGMQMLNVKLGGTLYQDIKSIETDTHSAFFKKNKGSHQVYIQERSLLHSIVDKDSLWVNSMHHQAIKDLGSELVVSAFSQDNFIEAIEMPSRKFALAVQWHPEHMSKFDDQRKIFERFIKAAES